MLDTALFVCDIRTKSLSVSGGVAVCTYSTTTVHALMFVFGVSHRVKTGRGGGGWQSTPSLPNAS